MHNMDREKLLKQVTIMDFMATDLHLYLNIHRNDTEALKMYNDVVAKGAKARAEYEKHFGPLTASHSTDTEMWRWNDSPWPWEADFNFNWDEGGIHNVGV